MIMPEMNNNISAIRRLDQVAISSKAAKILQTLLEENPRIHQLLVSSTTLEEASTNIQHFVLELFKTHPEAEKAATSAMPDIAQYQRLSWSDYALVRLYDYVTHAGKVFEDQNLRGGLTETNPVKVLWLAVKYGTGGALVDFFIDMLMLFRQLNGTLELNPPSQETLIRWMDQHPSGTDPHIVDCRSKNKARILRLIIQKLNRGELTSRRYVFDPGMSDDEKYALATTWWNDSNFHLKFAIRNPTLLNEMLANSLSDETMGLLNEALDAGIPFFVNPYYLSLLNIDDTSACHKSDRAIRDYIIYSKQLIREFGHIVAWEKEDKVQPGKPNAAGWLLPEGNNIHRRYPGVAIMIPDTAGRACAGLCVSCQRMYDFQSGRLNFNLETLLPKENWPVKLNRLMDYFENDSQLRDILITGGDALMSSDKSLGIILDAVYQMALRKRAANKQRKPNAQYVEIQRVRLGTRLPVYLPQRITPALIALLTEFKTKAASAGIRQFVIQTHVETAMEVTPEVVKAVHMLQSAGWVVTNQHVFTTATSRRGHLAKLRKVLNDLGILPYYTFCVKGYQENSANFATNARALQELKEEKRFGRFNSETEGNILQLMQDAASLPQQVEAIRKQNRHPFLATDRTVINLPGVGKSFTFRTIGITRHGRRILEFDYDHSRKHSPVIHQMGKVTIIESKSIHSYLKQLEAMGENTTEYDSLYGYSMHVTEGSTALFKYPDLPFTPTSLMTNLETKDR